MYVFDAATGILISGNPATNSLPDNATLSTPPAPDGNLLPHFQNGRWALMELEGQSPNAGQRARLASELSMSVSTIEELRAYALFKIDDMAGVTRAKFITEVPGQAATYLIKAEQAKEYRAAGYPEDATPWPMIEAESQALGVSTRQAADLALQTEALWTNVLAPVIERIRRGYKTVASAASTREQIRASIDGAQAQLALIGA